MAHSLSKPQSLRAWPASRLPLRLAERRSVLILGDAFFLVIAGVLALATWAALAEGVAWGQRLLATASPWLLGLGLGWWVVWAGAGGYDLRRAASVSAAGRTLLGTALVVGVGYLVVFYVLSLPLYAFRISWPGQGEAGMLRLLPALFLASALASELFWRGLYAQVLTRARFRRRVLIVGAGQSGQAIAQALAERGDGSHDLVGFVDDDPAKQGGWVSGAKGGRVLGNRYALKDLISEQAVSTVVVAITHGIDGELLPFLLDCLELGVEIVPMAVLYEVLTGRVPVEHVGDSWYVAMPLQHPSTGSLFSAARRVMDIFLAGLGLVFLALALPFIAAAIYLDSPGPIFYTQVRVGKGGRLFRAYKFRSMIPDAEKGRAVWAQQHDSRVTRVGRFLRKTHIDEFPQFLNIIKGEMSPVGPRPERPEFAAELAQQIPFYRIRHAVKPGMAGWALVQQGYAASQEDALLRLQYDLYYIKHQSFWLDLVILFRTVLDTVTLGGR